MVVLLRMLGLSCFGLIVVLYHFNFNKWSIVSAYVVRTALMNCTYPLEESTLNPSLLCCRGMAGAW